MVFPFWSLCIIGVAVSFFLFLLGRKIAPRLGLIDQPGGRKKHEGVIPLIGGLVIVPVYAVLIWLGDFESSLPLYPLLGGASFLLIIGALDDKFTLHPWVRFFIQIFVALYTVVFCGAELNNLGNLFGFGIVWLGPLSIIFSVTCFVLFMNALNMLDGLDGLAGGYVFIALGFIALTAHHTNVEWVMQNALLLMVPVAIFLIFNARYPFHKKASLFMGDAGSLSLALIIGFYAIHLVTTSEINPQGHNVLLSPIFIIWLMSVPIMETFSIFFTRMKNGRSPFDADRLHLHYVLIDKGWNPAFIVPFMWGLSILTAGIGYFGLVYGVSDTVLLYSWSAALLGITYYRLKIFAK